MEVGPLTPGMVAQVFQIQAQTRDEHPVRGRGPLVLEADLAVLQPQGVDFQKQLGRVAHLLGQFHRLLRMFLFHGLGGCAGDVIHAQVLKIDFCKVGLLGLRRVFHRTIRGEEAAGGFQLVVLGEGTEAVQGNLLQTDLSLGGGIGLAEEIRRPLEPDLARIEQDAFHGHRGGVGALGRGDVAHILGNHVDLGELDGLAGRPPGKEEQGTILNAHPIQLERKHGFHGALPPLFL